MTFLDDITGYMLKSTPIGIVLEKYDFQKQTLSEEEEYVLLLSELDKEQEKLDVNKKVTR